MQAKIVRSFQSILPAFIMLRQGLHWIVAALFRVWRWLNALDLPLSPLQWILLFYLVFGAAYLVATPVFEANDEIWHFGYVEHVRETGALPVQLFDGAETSYQQHGSQPPLYYGLVALLTSPLNIDDVEHYRRLNPHVTSNQPGAFGNKNLIIHDETLSPIHGTGLAVWVARLFGLALGFGTIFFVYKIGELIAPQRSTVAFVAAAITGLNPMFIFVSTSVNNDVLAMILNGALVLLMLRTLRDGFSLRYSIAIALLFALSSITKLTSLPLLPVLIGVALFVYYKSRDRRGLLIFICLLALCWLVIAGWWFWRNIELYGEPFGMITMANIAGPRGINFSLVDLFAEYQQFRMSYWGLFGALNIQVTGIFYVLLDLVTLLSGVGCIFLILQLLAISDLAYARYELAHLLTLLSALVLLWLGLLYWSTLTRAAEGRTLFPLVSVVSPLLAVGFVEVVWWIVFSLRPPDLDFVRAGDAVPKELLNNTMVWQLRFLGVVALFAPFTVIASQYNPPQPLVELPERALPIYAEFGDVALVAYERIDRRYSTGDQVRLQLYWKVLQQSATDNSILLTLVDDKRQEIGAYTSYPGAGSLRTSAWQAGAIYPDEYLITINQAAYGRYPFDLQVEWENRDTLEDIQATDLAGKLIEPVLLDAGAVVTVRFQSEATGLNELPTEMQPVFDEAIRLEAFQLDLELNEVILSWKTESSPDEDYTVFAHMLDGEGKIIAQADAPPRLPTGYWRWGETYTTFHRFPAEFNLLDYEVIVGLYLNDGATYPKAEYLKTIEVPEEDSAAEGENAIEGDEDDEAGIAGETEIALDSFKIPWELAAEVLALTPQPTEEGGAEPTDDASIRDEIRSN